MAGFPKYLSVQTHGGRCCGIKTIWNFPYSRDEIVQAKRKTRVSDDTDYHGRTVTKSFNFHTEARPQETAEERLRAAVAFIKEKRPAGLIEVTMVKCQMGLWGKLLEELGFKEVSSFINSNTDTTVKVLHLAYNEGYVGAYNDEDYEEDEDEDDYYEENF